MLSSRTCQSVGYGIRTKEEQVVRKTSTSVVSTVVKLEMPERTCAIVKGRSGVAAKHSLIVHDGVIDPGYRGEIKVISHNFFDNDYTFQKGGRVAQLLLIETLSPLLFKSNF